MRDAILERHNMQSNNNVKTSWEFTKIYNFLLLCLLIRDTDLTGSSLQNRPFHNSNKRDFSYMYTTNHCVKSVCIRSYSGPHFPAFGLNTEIYSVSLRIQSKCGKIRTTKPPNTDTFLAVNIITSYNSLRENCYKQNKF